MAFVCKAVGYQVAIQAPIANSGLFEINLVTGTVTTINADIGLITTGIGYNVIDNLIYGVANNTADFLSLNELGIVTNMGPIAGVPVTSYNVADIDLAGELYIYSSTQSNYYVIDVDPFSGTFGTLLAIRPITPTNAADWSFNPVDGLLYGIITNTSIVTRINPISGFVTPLATVGLPIGGGGWGATFFDANGILYAIENSTGRIYRVVIAGLNASGQLFSQSIATGQNDGASCPLQAIEIDYGDAPDTGIGTGTGNYNTLLASNGPRHQIINDLFLGTVVTGEDDAYQNPTATGDDIGAGIQDDGVILPLAPVVTTDLTYAINMQVTNDTGSNANLYVWIDFDRNGVFQGEESAVPIVVPSAIGVQNVVTNFNLPFIPTPGTSFVRARLTTDTLTNTNPATSEDTRSIGPATDGEVEDYSIEIINVDFGDAPDTGIGTGIGNYNTLLASNGPRHQIVSELFLGTQITAEAEAYQNFDATGDDLGAGVQDDGVTLPLTSVLTTDLIYSINMNITNNTGSNANLYVWIDFDRNGVFQGEESATPIVVPSAVGVQNVVANFNLPFIPTTGISFVRARLTTDTLINLNIDPTLEDTRSLGEATDGEVEDYIIEIVGIDFGDAPDVALGTDTGNYNTLLVSNGPTHQIINSLFLGTQVTAEADAYQNATATGDDIGAGIQDDGVTLPLTPVLTTDLIYAINMQVTNDTGSNANLYVWIDFNADGIFQGEESADPIVVPSIIGLQNVVANFTLPFIPIPGISFVRGRLTTDTLININIDPTLEDTRSLGEATDGEVEDYLIEIIGIDFGDAPDIALGTSTGNYNTLLVSNGPTHQMVNELFLGAQITAEADAYQNFDATGDDIGLGIQDDGVSLPLPPIYTTDVTYAINMQVTNNTGSNANLYVWIDFDSNGVFQGEEAATPIVVPSIVGLQNVVANFNLPFVPTPGFSFVRGRLTTDHLINFNADPALEDTRSLGSASDGEVEDYLIEIIGIDFGDAPDIAPGTGSGNYNTLLASNGPRHQIKNELFLGTQITVEADAYQNPTATGDDIGLGIQDDGVSLPLTPIFTTDVAYAINMKVTNNTGSNANLYVWIDFNSNGVFQGEEAAAPIVVPSFVGLQNVVANFNLPFMPTTGISFVRARLTSDNLINSNADPAQEDTRSLGEASDGEVEDYRIEIIGVDFGDAPDMASGTGLGNYNTLLASNGPRHQIVNELFLGTQITAEADAYENATATGDDIGLGIQDDGVTLPLTPILTTDVTYAINFQVTNKTGLNANLYVWIDFNRDGIFAGEEAAAPIVVASIIGLQNVVANFNLPFMPTSGISFVRARLTTDHLMNTNADPALEDTRSLGEASDGEVEDYRIEIIGVDFGDAPDISLGTGIGNYNTLLASNGPRHKIIKELFLGTQITAEADAYENATATGDDIGAGIQDDGVTLPLPPVVTPCTTTYIIENMVVTNNTGINANLYAWIDFNRNGVFQGRESAQPIVVQSEPNPQLVNVNFNLPVGTLVSGTSFVRVRLTTDTLINTNINPDLEDTRSLGLATDGEVEDYMIETIVLTDLITPIKTADVTIAITGDIVNFSITIPNTSPYDTRNLVFRDPLPAGLYLIPESFTVNGVIVNDPNLVLGVPIGDLPSGAVTIVAFSTKVSDAKSLCGTTISNQAFITMNFPEFIEVCEGRPVTIPTTVFDIFIECVSMEVVKEADKSFVNVGEVVTYTITITNDGSVTLEHVILIDEISCCGSFIPNSVQINGINIPGINPEIGIPIGILNPEESVIVKFLVILCEICCPPRLLNRALVTYRYKVKDITKTGDHLSNLVIVNTGL